jgi:hypothetical protein
MERHFKAGVLLISLVIAGLQVPILKAQQSKMAAVPIPAQISAAKKVFVANAGGDSLYTEDPLFAGGPDRAYNQFYAAMKIWGKYELVSSPADADLLFDIRFTVPPIAQPVVKGDSIGAAAFDPQLRLEIRDPKSTAILWGFTEHLQWAILKGNRDKNFDLAMARIVAETQKLSAQATADDSRK